MTESRRHSFVVLELVSKQTRIRVDRQSKTAPQQEGRKPCSRFAVTLLRSVIAPAVPFGARHRDLSVWLKAAIGLYVPSRNMCAIPHASRGEPRVGAMTGRYGAAALISCQVRHHGEAAAGVGVRRIDVADPGQETPLPAPTVGSAVADSLSAVLRTDDAVARCHLRRRSGSSPWRSPMPASMSPSMPMSLPLPAL